MIKAGAISDEKQGWERSSFFIKNENINIPPYDWYGSYGNKLNTDRKYEEKVLGDCKYEFSDHHSLVSKIILVCYYIIIKYFITNNSKFKISTSHFSTQL